MEIIFNIVISVMTIVVTLLATIGLYQLASSIFRSSWMLRRSSGPFHCYYANEKDIMADKRARHMASICHYGYTDSFLNHYCTTLSTDSLPMEKLLSWTRTIAEDLQEHPSPLLRVGYWHRYMNRLPNKLITAHPFVDEFTPCEESYLWGAVYYWLRCFTPEELHPELLGCIKDNACPKLYTQPYFNYFFKKAKQVDVATKENIRPIVNINIGQMAIENKGQMNNTMTPT